MVTGRKVSLNIKEYQCQHEEIGEWMSVTKQRERRKENSLFWQLPESLEN